MKRKTKKVRTEKQIRAHSYTWSKNICKAFIKQLDWISKHIDKTGADNTEIRNSVMAIQLELRTLIIRLHKAFWKGR